MTILFRWFALTVIIAGLGTAGQCMQVSAAVDNAQPPALSPAEQSSLSVTINAVQDTVDAGAPVRVKAVVTNRSNHQVKLWFRDLGDQSAWVYRVDVHNENGNQPFDTKLGRLFKYNAKGGSPNLGPGTILSGHGGFVSLMPGGSDTDIIDIAARYDLSQPGRYTVQVQRFAWGESVAAKSNSIIVTINPVQGAQSSLLPDPVNVGQQTFSLSIKTLDVTTDLLSRLELQITTRNISKRNILLWAEKSSQEQAGVTYRVDVSDGNGKSLAETEFGRQARSRADVPNEANPGALSPASGERLVLKPGEDWTDTIDLKTLYHLQQLGEYTVQVRRFDPATGTTVRSNTVKVNITP